MPRPKADSDKITASILAEAERLLEETSGRRLILSDIAARLGMSQSYLHVFFPTKRDLVRALALRWFAEVEAASRAALEAPVPPAERLERWLLGILRLKRDRFDANPALFEAYLSLAEDHMDTVRAHVASLRADLTGIVAALCGPEDATRWVPLVEDATLLFRTPHNIARYRPMATDARARDVCEMLAAQMAAAQSS